MSDFARLPLEQFVAELASASPTPGGGTAAAVAGALGASLAEMVANLTLSKEKFAAAHEAMRSIAQAAQLARSQFLDLAGEDAQAYDAVVAARRLSKETEEEKRARAAAIAEANRKATEVPLRTARTAARLLAILPELVEKGNPSALSDAGAAALMLEAAAEAALLNVGINLPGVADAAFVSRMQQETISIQEETRRIRSEVMGAVRKRF